MKKIKKESTIKVKKVGKSADKIKLQYEKVVIDGETKTKITYPDGTVDYRVS